MTLDDDVKAATKRLSPPSPPGTEILIQQFVELKKRVEKLERTVGVLQEQLSNARSMSARY